MAIDVQEFINKIEKEPELKQGLAALLEAARPEQRSSKMTYAEFLAWADEDTLAEWVDGEVVMSSPASDRHQDIMGFLTSVLRIFTEQHDLGVVRCAPFQMKLERGREPDILFVSSEHLEQLRTAYLDGPADLVVEIISLESVDRDRGTKFVEYEAAGIPEYWLIDPLRKWAEFYQLNKEGRYTPAFVGHQDVYQAAAIPGFWLRVEWLWQTPLPPILDVIRELQLI